MEEEARLRVFVSVPVPENFQWAFAAYRDQAPGIEGVKWTKKNNLHITVFFIGDVAEEKMSVLAHRLQRVANNTPQFDLVFDRVRPAPAKSPRMLWGVFQESGAFRALAERVKETLLRENETAGETLFNVQATKRLIPHITLARFGVSDVPSDPEVLPPETDADGLTLPVKHIELVRSELGKDGSTYTTLQRYPLEGV